MPRSNRPRRNGWCASEHVAQIPDLIRLRDGARRTEWKRGHEWTVQPIRGERAVKPYRCPGCSLEITVGTAHLAVWLADSVRGDEAALADRRHWHTHCWRIA